MNNPEGPLSIAFSPFLQLVRVCPTLPENELNFLISVQVAIRFYLLKLSFYEPLIFSFQGAIVSVRYEWFLKRLNTFVGIGRAKRLFPSTVPSGQETKYSAPAVIFHFGYSSRRFLIRLSTFSGNYIKYHLIPDYCRGTGYGRVMTTRLPFPSNFNALTSRFFESFSLSYVCSPFG